jgi:hypothetical protein
MPSPEHAAASPEAALANHTLGLLGAGETEEITVRDVGGAGGRWSSTDPT